MINVRIGHHACHGSSRGEWYVCRDVGSDHDSVWGCERQEYLHADGVWRGSTFSGEGWGMPTGYYATEGDAKAALANARGKVAG